jgi:glycosyltransferase involved in cell wall biosynthesis
MKLLVFAHTPPPHHGQSYMVQLLLNGFGGDARKKNSAAPNPHGIECYHVNARFSRGLSDVGEFQGTKMFLIFWFCAQALWVWFRYGVKNFYYVPAPGKRVALYRDWLVMLLCRPFFKNIILHWEAAGLAKWLETEATIGSRAATYRLFKPVNLSIVLSHYNMADAKKFLSHHIHVVNNGIPDPCPNFAATILSQRRSRLAARIKLFAGESSNPPETTGTGENLEIVKVLFLANGLREKGLFAAMRGVVAANRKLAASGRPMRMKLVFAGNFMTNEERAEFDELLRQPEFAAAVNHLGFVSGEEKIRALREADLFCFPTLYHGENQPVCLIEAMAFGLPIVTTRWRSLPEMLPPDYPGLVNGHDADEIAAALLKISVLETSETLREIFLSRFSLEQYLTGMAAAFRSVETEAEK